MILFPLTLLAEPTTSLLASISQPQATGTWSWWWTPVIAFLTAVVGTALTHFFTQSRDQSSWLRERMFDVAQQLADNYNIIVAETNKVPLLADQPGLSTPDHVIEFLAARDWIAFDAGLRGYLVAANQAKLLDLSSNFHFVVSDAAVRAEIDAEYIRGAFSDWPEESKPTPKSYDSGRKRDYAKLRDSHDELMATITTRHFRPRAQTLWAKVTEVPYRIRRFRIRTPNRIRNVSQ